MGDEMTGAELLREAARLMRERANAATPGPWHARPFSRRPEAYSRIWYGEAGSPATQLIPRNDAEHMSSWHPAVALAVANWLEATADDLEIEDDHDGWDSSVYTAAVATARAYLSAPVSAGEPKENA